MATVLGGDEIAIRTELAGASPVIAQAGAYSARSMNRAKEMAPPAAVISAWIRSSKRALCAAAADRGRQAVVRTGGWNHERCRRNGWMGSESVSGCFTTGAGSGADPPLDYSLGTMVFSWIQISAANKLQLLENYASPPTNFPTRNHS